VGRLTLSDDEALAFIAAIISDLVRGDATSYAGWTIHVTGSARFVGSLSITATAAEDRLIRVR
jgi:hypothetical protein